MVVCGLLCVRLRFVLIILISFKFGKLCFLVISCVLIMIFVLFFFMIFIFCFSCLGLLGRLDESISIFVLGNRFVIFLVMCFIFGL